MVDAFGSITWWGFSPCLDLQSELQSHGLAPSQFGRGSSDSDTGDTLNILLVGAGDCRHILKTLASSYKHAPRNINFYIVENNLELYARDLLLLGIALEPLGRMGLQDKTELFLELFGNSLVRQQSIEYVQHQATEFIRMVTDLDYLEEKMSLVDISALKYKERDFLEGIFKFWRNPDSDVFDVKLCWDLRVRQHLGSRYDAIPNVFDWDCTMKLAEKGADIIYSRDYARWRKEGVAFEIREGTYDVPNKTIASGRLIKHEGECYPRRGYWGDILVSPYIQFGIESEEKSFFKKSNNIYTKTAQDVSEYNVLSMMYEIGKKEKYFPPTKDEEAKNTAGKATLTEVIEEEEEEVEDDFENKTKMYGTADASNQEFETLSIDYAKVYFLPVGSVADLYKKGRYQKLFDLIYISNSMVHHLSENVVATFNESATLILETAKFMLELKNDQCKEFVTKVTAIAEGLGCQVLSKDIVGDVDDAFLSFTYSRPSSS